MKSFENKVAAVTGADSGIGRELVVLDGIRRNITVGYSRFSPK